MGERRDGSEPAAGEGGAEDGPVGGERAVTGGEPLRATPATAVCFDMDGVLVDSESYWVPLEESEILPRVVPDEEVAVDDITGMNYREIYDHLADAHDVAVSREEFVAIYDEAAMEIFGERADLLPGLADLLATLRGRGVAVALVTSSPPHWIEAVLDRFDLHGAFDAVVSAADIDAAGKPAPAIYEHAADRLGVAPAEAVAVEDSANGLRAAAAAGMTVVGFRFGGTPGDETAADAVADSPAALADLLLSLTA